MMFDEFAEELDRQHFKLHVRLHDYRFIEAVDLRRVLFQDNVGVGEMSNRATRSIELFLRPPNVIPIVRFEARTISVEVSERPHHFVGGWGCGPHVAAIHQPVQIPAIAVGELLVDDYLRPLLSRERLQEIVQLLDRPLPVMPGAKPIWLCPDDTGKPQKSTRSMPNRGNSRRTKPAKR